LPRRFHEISPSSQRLQFPPKKEDFQAHHCNTLEKITGLSPCSSVGSNSGASAAGMAVPQKLLDSFQDYVEYPTNLVFQPDPTNELISCRDRLAHSTTQDSRVQVYFLDLHYSIDCAQESFLGGANLML
jgi:hypothetical protein